MITKSPDALIIGGGIIGLTTALELNRAGLKVSILDQAEIGRGASWAAGGILSSLPPDDIAPELRSLLEESLAVYPNFCAQLHESTGIDPEYWRCGADIIKDGKTVYDPTIAQVRNPRLLKALVAHLGQSGVSLRPHTPARGFQMSGDRVIGVRTTSGVIPSAVTVVCAGAWSGSLTGLPITPVKGQMLLLNGKPKQLNRMVIDNHAYLVPRRDGKILVGSTLEDAGYDLTPTVAARASLRACAGRLAPGLKNADVLHHWAGLRPRSAGEIPIIAADAVKRGIYHNTGHYRLGITLAPASASCFKQLLDL